MIGRHKVTKDEDLNSRQAVLWMHPSAIVPLMTSSRWVITDGHLPEDVKYHSVFWEPQRQIWGVVCTSKDFKPVLAGQKMPELPQVSFKFYNPNVDGIIE